MNKNDFYLNGWRHCQFIPPTTTTTSTLMTAKMHCATVTPMWNCSSFYHIHIHLLSLSSCLPFSFLFFPSFIFHILFWLMNWKPQCKWTFILPNEQQHWAKQQTLYYIVVLVLCLHIIFFPPVLAWLSESVCNLFASELWR